MVLSPLSLVKIGALFVIISDMMKKFITIIISGILLIPVLLVSLVNQSCRVKIWHCFNDVVHTYSVMPEAKVDQLFTLCVNFLLILGKRVGMSYNEINI